MVIPLLLLQLGGIINLPKTEQMFSPLTTVDLMHKLTNQPSRPAKQTTNQPTSQQTNQPTSQLGFLRK